ncbi:MAG: hypothetical protein JWM33_2412 [Caulobacteraceae bacterium]|nr:hypothetical protein [Caulobacteraceae bacterium]
MQKALHRIWLIAAMSGLLASGVAEAAQPGWVKVPTRAQWDQFYPREAMAASVKGKATVNCTATPVGLLTDCKLTAESPTGYNFGSAALNLAPFYQFAQTPQSHAITLTITFDTYDAAASIQAYETQLQRDGIDVEKLKHDLATNDLALLADMRSQGFDPDKMRVALGMAPDRAPGSSVRLLSSPPWVEAPSWAQIDAAWPRFATAATGDVSLQCSLQATGQLKSCQALSEKPTGQGFSQAANTLSKLFKVQLPPLASGQTFPSTVVQIAIHMAKPGAARPAGVITRPALLVQPSATAIKAAVASLVPAGFSATVGLRCTVAAQGQVTQCQPPTGPLATNPELAKTLLGLASSFRVSAWQQGVGPTEGATVSLPISIGGPVTP